MEERIKETLSAVFNLPIEKINREVTPHTIEGWDSLTHMKMVTALEEEFDIRFEDDEIPSLVSYNIIFATISAYTE